LNSLADSDPYLEGKTTVRGDIVPTKKPLGADEKAQDAITHAIAHMDRSRLIEVLAQMKVVYTLEFPASSIVLS
jgi:hypothetical protein